MQIFTRSRVRDSRVFMSMDQYSFDQNHNPQHQYDGHFGLKSWNGIYQITKDCPHRNFRKRMISGETILGDFLMTKNEFTIAPSNLIVGPHPSQGCLHIEGDWTTEWTKNISGDSSVQAISSSYMTGPVLVKAYAKINESASLAPETLSDLSRTVDMFKHPFKNARKLLSKMYKKRAKLLETTKNVTKASADAWLEYRYGWQPIMIDCDNIIDAVHESREKTDRKRLIVRASDKDSKVTVGNFVDWPQGDYKITGSIREEKIASAHAGVVIDCCSLTRSQQLAKKLGYRPRDLIAFGWEKVPWSFVADWFCNVGDWLQAITPDPWINVQGNWVTSVEVYIRDFPSGTVTRRIPNTPATTYSGTYGQSKKIYTTVSRSINQELPSYPQLTFKPLSRLHSVDAAALALNHIVGQLKGLRH